MIHDILIDSQHSRILASALIWGQVYAASLTANSNTVWADPNENSLHNLATADATKALQRFMTFVNQPTTKGSQSQ